MKKCFLITTTTLLILSACKKDISNGSSEFSSSGSEKTTFINDFNGNSRSYIDLVALYEDYNKPKDALIHLQGFNTYGNQVSGGKGSYNIQALSSCNKENKKISLKINETIYEGSGTTLLKGEAQADKDAIYGLLGKSSSYLLGNDDGNIITLQANLPNQPVFGVYDKYMPGEGLIADATKPFSLRWDMNGNNELGAVLITIKSSNPDYSKNVIYILTDDDGDYTISPEVLAKFRGLEITDFSVSRGAYIPSKFEIAGQEKKAMLYAILHSHLYVALK